METKLKIVTALLVPYAFLCAGLYQIAFWSPFGINIFPYLGITDIILSFIQPFLYSSFGAVIFFPFQHIIYGDFFPYGDGNIEEPSIRKKIIWFVVKFVYVGVMAYYLILHEDKWKGLYIPIYAFLGLSFMSTEFLLKKNLIKHDKIYFAFTSFLILMPLVSFYIGTANAKKIYTNESYEYSTYVIPNTTLKFLGKGSDHFIFVSLDNKEKFFFSTSEINGLKLQQFEQLDEKSQTNN
jgi:hypothetical protein